MGIASLLLGEANPFSQWVGENQNFLGAIGGGLGQGQNIQGGLAAGLAQLPQAKALDRADAEKRKADKLAETQLSLTDNWLKANYPQYAHLPPEQGFRLAMQAEQEKISGGGAAQNPYMSAGDGQFFNWQTGEYTSNPNAAPGDGLKTGMGVPVSLRNKQTGQWAPFAQTDNGQLINTLTGEPATDEMWEYDPGMVAGTRAQQTTIGKGMGERELQAPMAEVNLQRLDAQSDNVISAIDKAGGQAAWDSTGVIGQVLGGVAGTRAFDLRETAKTVKANIGFAELQAMRDASPTGGALGQVAVQELEALQSTLASLNPDQSEEQLRQNLTLVKELLERQKKYRRQAAEAKYGGNVQQPPPSGGAGGTGGYTVLGVE